MAILVTGGAGYVGSHAVAWLLRAGHDVVVYDNLSLGHRSAVPAGSLVQGELRDRERLVDVLREKRIQAVMHFAAFSLVGQSVREPSVYWWNNLVGTLSLLEAMRATGVTRIVFSSTCATYGEPSKVPISEDTPQQPVSPYGASKLAVERALAARAEASASAR